MFVLMAAGGTGGHIAPALATADALRAMDPAMRIGFVASDGGGDQALRQAEVYRVAQWPKTPLPSRWSSPHMWTFPFRVLGNAARARRMLRNDPPDVVVGFGGYASGPLLLMASMAGIPTVIHEPNVLPGRANRWLSPWVDCVATSFTETHQHFERRWISLTCTGTPVRAGVLAHEAARAYERFGLDSSARTVLVLGGSQGARTLNTEMPKVMGALRQAGLHVQVLHIVGRGDMAAVREAYAREGVSGCVVSFVTEMADAYTVADLAVARAGASTLAELTCVGLPMLLVPYPFAGGHQRWNARLMEQAGAAVVVEETELSVQALSQPLLRILTQEATHRQMVKACRQVGRPDASQRLALEIFALGMQHQKRQQQQQQRNIRQSSLARMSHHDAS